MKKCINCESNIRETDKFCRNCGCKVHKNSYYILINFAIKFFNIDYYKCELTQCFT